MTEKIDKKTEREARKAQRKLLNAARNMRSKMIRFCQDERFAPLLGSGLPLYWRDFYDHTNADEMDMNESLRFFDWLFFDYQPDPAQPRIAELFAQEKREELDERERQLIDAWVDTPAPSAYEYLDFDAINARFKLKNYLGEQEDVVAFAPAGAGQSKKGDLILTRLLPVDEDLIFSTVGAFIPREELDGLREMIADARAEDAKTYPDASERDFMRRNNHLIVHFAIDKSIDAGRFAVSRLDPKRIDKAVKKVGKKIAKKIGRKKKR